ncbi:acyl-ACP desaturase [Skermania piniformis]|nr:acyl-ACP desaturase [Skermania piniformis]
MPNQMTDRELLDELALEADLNLRRHVGEASEWQAHDLVPWDDGRNFAFLGGTDWSAEQSTLSDTARLALTVSVLVADNLPAYHRELARHLGHVGAWWRWVGRWTAEENRHAIVLRDYLILTRAVDPVELERIRMAHMTRGFVVEPMHLIDWLADCAFAEAAATIRHRNTAALDENEIVTAISTRIARDDELQTVFYANLIGAAFDLAPDQTMRAVADRVHGFRVPEVELPGGGDATAELAAAGIYLPERAPELVFGPLLEQWNVFGRTDLGETGAAARDELVRIREFSSAR